MTPVRGFKCCCHLLFCGNGIDFYSAPSGLNFPTCNLSTGLHPVLIYDTPSGVERLLPFVVLWQRKRFLFRPFRAEFSHLPFITGLHPLLIYDTPSGLEKLLPFVVLLHRNRFFSRPLRAEFSLLNFLHRTSHRGLPCADLCDPPSGFEGCCHLLFCGNGIDFYSAPSGLSFPTCHLLQG